MRKNSFFIFFFGMILMSLGSFSIEKAYAYPTSCGEISCGGCSCEGWPSDNDGCSGCGHALCKRSYCVCGYSNCCYLLNPLDPNSCVACDDLCECGCGGGGGGGDPEPTNTPAPTPTACRNPPAPSLNSPANGACIASGSNVNLVVNSVEATCGGNAVQDGVRSEES